jgi:hypothetical protein
MCSIFDIKVNLKPALGTEEVLSLLKMEGVIRALPVTWSYVKMNDTAYYAPSWDDWRKIIEYLQPRVPKYFPQRADCEFMACWFYVHVCEDFNVNTMCMVEGYADVGKGPERHAWNVFTDGAYFYQLEPQNGVIVDIEDQSYVPDRIIAG